ncbi:hypothetical protein [uncultured Clostridium sp.]|jgi:hypothetical protein|uniref:hypothetical protein n=1 Tax=uncultured Clostridium sp. TaxID=59620 RepID=UPI0025911EA8|nr:hypothetical protein [uncultured Clostridium sp.]
MKTTIFIAELSNENQEKIKKMIIEFLTTEGYENKKIQEIIENVMNERLCNLEEFIDIEPFLKKGKVIFIKNMR